LLQSLEQVNGVHHSILQKMKMHAIRCNFTHYTELKEELDSIITQLEAYDTSHLALKYRGKYYLVRKMYYVEINRFNKIYANKD
jgi:hypothetical protein